MKWVSIFSATRKSAITPSFMGLIASMFSDCPAHHLLGFPANGHDFAAILFNRHDRRLVDDDSATLCVDQGVGGAQVNREVGGNQAKDRPEAITALTHLLLRENPGS
jgi:hypothetical protein